MKIGIVCYPTFGGSGVVATELGIALSQKGHEVHFITYNQPARLSFLSDDIYFHQVFVEEYPLFHYQPYELALSTKMVEVVKEKQLDLLHVHYAIPHAYAGYMAKKMLQEMGISIKIVTTLHGTDITLVGSHPSYKTAVEFSINQSDEVTAVSESLKQETLALFDIKNDIKVIPNFINFEKYPDREDPVCKDIHISEKDEYVVSHISNFRPVKRTFDVIKIFHGIQQKVNAKLMLIGDGPDREHVEYLTKELGIFHKVHFLGNCQEVNKVLCYSDLFLLPSEKESFGLAALEAMAAKTPVISTDVGGLKEVNVDGETGYTCRLGDVDQMIEKSVFLLSNPEKLESFKQQAKKRAHAFSIEKIIPLYEELYNVLI
jgi:N-acetyl-alpha-D-glucosaminyl L-malate synthase BshA